MPPALDASPAPERAWDARAPYARLGLLALGLALVPFTWTTCSEQPQTGLDLMAREPGSAAVVLVTAALSALLGVLVARRRSDLVRGALHLGAAVLAGVAAFELFGELLLAEWRLPAWLAVGATLGLVLDAGGRFFLVLHSLRPLPRGSGWLLGGTALLTLAFAVALVVDDGSLLSAGLVVLASPALLPPLGLLLVEVGRGRGLLGPAAALACGAATWLCAPLFVLATEPSAGRDLVVVALLAVGSPWLVRALRAQRPGRAP